ncbi:hypothetical protein J3E72DRAFT_379459 [Bipolaris maydis]|uniref:uncharacterized protein n=1 Tax=Cochliobolus heterostrophus TaxID=5016 RepID=UPI0024D7EC3E|nr:hypothetical protein BM1_04028 [Bipolaris maydis]KAJ5055522.1 hypothetical protein J3E74DRAFT_411092 [Bipolaris maydis]KAJ6193104.1 hypothetical protein J3E72DRAFT_379459 [Bipolaris maydis]KAJ6204156.1 hypothetical protein PSV09DRAFT_2404693 [Bipolaris maydis]KAJ6265921.1 hypothetical protein PSV08DRAFT_252398 [Bipolaris maydis]
MFFKLAILSTLSAFQAAALVTDRSGNDQRPLKPEAATTKNQPFQLLVDDGFYFGNPSTDCKHSSQPYIYQQYTRFTDDYTYLSTMLAPDVDFTVVGHHALSGHYHDFKHFYVNAFYRLGSCITEVYPELFKLTLLTIHGGCNEEWSVQEIRGQGRANNGRDFDIINVWVTKWHNGRIVKVRTYIDAVESMIMLKENEVWTNSSTETEHTNFLPGPRGMPDMAALGEFLAKGGHY